jgi:hypothetical protein
VNQVLDVFDRRLGGTDRTQYGIYLPDTGLFDTLKTKKSVLVRNKSIADLTNL